MYLRAQLPPGVPGGAGRQTGSRVAGRGRLSGGRVEARKWRRGGVGSPNGPAGSAPAGAASRRASFSQSPGSISIVVSQTPRLPATTIRPPSRRTLCTRYSYSPTGEVIFIRRRLRRGVARGGRPGREAREDRRERRHLVGAQVVEEAA